MPTKLLVKPYVIPTLPMSFNHPRTFFNKIVCCDKNTSSSSTSSSSSGDKKFRLKLVGPSLGENNKWKFSEIDTNALQQSVGKWVSRTQNFLNEVTSPLTIDSRMPKGNLSLAAIVSIEQFSRMNGLTGQQLQNIFKDLVSDSVYSDPRNLVEYCCFRFLSRDNSSEIHSSLKEPAFQRLIFITMLAWENPYRSRQPKAYERNNLKTRLVGEEAFVRIAPAVSGVADWPTAHNLFRVLAGDSRGLPFSLWSTYINELLRVHDARKSYQFQEYKNSGERILCLGSSRKQPVLKWKNNVAWPGKLTLTDRALYFEAVDLGGTKEALRLDLTTDSSRVEKTRVGPLGLDIFDSAISVTSDPESEGWKLEFFDVGNELRRDVWHALIYEVIALYKFIREFGPDDGDLSVLNVYGAQKGKERATTQATNAIARLQALQFIRKLLDEPMKLVQFSFLQNVPYGDVVLQTLAVNCWGGPLITKSTVRSPGELAKSTSEVSESADYIFDIDGSVYLRKWMRSQSWASNASLTFWKNISTKQGIVFSKNLAVADMNLIQKAARTCRQKYQVAEKTQATIDAAMIEGIPNNIDLFKELVLPLSVVAKNIEKLRRWEDPLLTASFLAVTYTLIFRNMLSYIFPAALMILAASMLLLKGLKEQGRLGKYFGKVTIRDQPPSNTLQKIIGVKEAMREVERFLQNVNVAVLKIRSIILAGQPQITTEVALALLLGASVLLVIPFRYILAFVVFDLFTRELKFRRQMVLRFMSILKERWDTVPAAPVVVVPYEVDQSDVLNQKKEQNNVRNPKNKSDGQLDTS
ncbi:hypothetical protein Leryth_013988 [Lithospermum erythrorhizon]|nr:hypothetical protein Leryth_013988 [Lithospermum erythrorhizon]